MKKFEIRSSNSKDDLEVFHYPANSKFIKGVLQLVHGMSEYVGRYERFIEFLNSNGYIVIGHNQIGHGQTAKNPGFFNENDGPEYLVRDVYQVNKRIHTLYPKLPVILLGHSMGSLITRKYLSKYSETIDGYIMMGTLGKDPKEELNNLMLNLIKIFKGAKGTSKLVNDMAFKPYLKRIDNPVNSCAWLTKDDDICLKYSKDPLCNISFTMQGLIDIQSMRKEVNDDSWFTSFRKNLPILVTSGEEDPCGDYGVAIKSIYQKLNENIDNVDMNLYPDDRHEILNELDRDVVYQDILDWMNNLCKKNYFQV